MQDVKNKALLGGGVVPSCDSRDVSTECFCPPQATVEPSVPCLFFSSLNIKAPYCVMRPYANVSQTTTCVSSLGVKEEPSMLIPLPGETDNIHPGAVFIPGGGKHRAKKALPRNS